MHIAVFGRSGLVSTGYKWQYRSLVCSSIYCYESTPTDLVLHWGTFFHARPMDGLFEQSTETPTDCTMTSLHNANMYGWGQNSCWWLELIPLGINGSVTQHFDVIRFSGGQWEREIKEAKRLWSNAMFSLSAVEQVLLKIHILKVCLIFYFFIHPTMGWAES